MKKNSSTGLPVIWETRRPKDSGQNTNEQMHALSNSINICVVFVTLNTAKSIQIIWTLKILTWLQIKLAKIAKYLFWTLFKNPKFVSKLWPHLKSMYTFLKIKRHDTSPTPNQYTTFYCELCWLVFSSAVTDWWTEVRAGGWREIFFPPRTRKFPCKGQREISPPPPPCTRKFPCKMQLNFYLKVQSIYILHQIFILSKISPTLCSKVWNLVPPKIWTFYPQKPKNLNLTNPLLMNYPWPIQVQKDLKDPNLILICTIKLLYTYFGRCCL